MDLISVLICVYNDQSTIAETIESILKQDYQNFEVVIIDDGSTDNTFNILNHYSTKHDNVICYQKYNSGLADSLNYGIKKCKGNFIARLDGDDLCMPNRLSFQYEVLKNSNFDIVGSNALFFGSKSGFLRQPEKDKSIKAKLIFEPALVHPSVMFKKSVFDSLMYDKRFLLAQDYNLWVNLSINNFVFYNIQKPLLKYRVRDNNVTNKRRLEQVGFGNDSRELYLNSLFPNTFSKDEVEDFNFFCTGYMQPERKIDLTIFYSSFRILSKLIFVRNPKYSRSYIVYYFVRKLIARVRSLCLN